MESSKLTDKELLDLALSEEIEQDNDFHDVKYYQEKYLIVDGKYKYYTKHLYSHYKVWSVDPISLDIFHDMLQLNRKHKDSIFINKEMCNLDLDRIVGDYVKKERARQKEKRLRQISCSEPKTKR